MTIVCYRDKETVSPGVARDGDAVFEAHGSFDMGFELAGPTGHVDEIELPGPVETRTNRLEHEAELPVVVGRVGRCLSPSATPGHNAGYTAASDVPASDLQRSDTGGISLAERLGTFRPLGPWVQIDLDPAVARIRFLANGQWRPDGSPAGDTPGELASIVEAEGPHAAIGTA